MFKVWIDWGGGDPEEVQRYEFATIAELNAFLEGVLSASTAWGIEDFRQFDSEQEMRECMEGGAA